MKCKNLIIIATVEAKKFVQGETGYLNKTTGKWQDQYPVCLRCGVDFSDDVKVTKEVYEALTEGRTYAFLGKYDNTGAYPSKDIEIVGFAVPTSLERGKEFVIIPSDEYASLNRGTSGRKVTEA